MNKVMNVVIQVRNDTYSNWVGKNPVLSKGEIAFVIDKQELIIGDGIKKFSELKPINSNIKDIVINNEDLTGTITNSVADIKLKNISTNGTYTKVTIDSKGRVTKGESLTESDIPNISKDKILGLGTVAEKNIGKNKGEIPILNSLGKIDEDLLPALAITDTFVVKNEEEMLKLDVQVGDVAIRNDLNKTFILKTSGANKIENWIELKTPDSKVESVNNKTGKIMLTTNDISEGENKYFSSDLWNKEFEKVKDNYIKSSEKLVLDGGMA